LTYIKQEKPAGCFNETSLADVHKLHIRVRLSHPFFYTFSFAPFLRLRVKLTAIIIGQPIEDICDLKRML